MKLKTKYNFIVFLLILITFQFYFINILKVNFFGVSLYLSSFIIFNFAIFIRTIKTQKKDNIIIYAICLFIFLCVILSRSLLYPSASSLLKNLIMGFAMYLPPIFLMQTTNLGTLFNKKLPRVLIILLLLQTVLAVLYILGLPTINLLTENLPDNYPRYVGIMGGANVNANFNALIMTILILSPNRYSILKKLFIIALCLVSTAPSFSKLPFLVALIILSYVIYESVKTRYIGITLIFMTMIVIFSFFLIKNNSETLSSIRTVERIINTIENGGDENRNNKNTFGLSLIFSDLTSFMIGPAGEKQIGRYVEFSDNSFLYLPISFGVPFSILFLLFMKKLLQISKQNVSKELVLYGLILFLTLFLNNAILWIPWMFLVAIGYWSISIKKREKQNFNLNE